MKLKKQTQFSKGGISIKSYMKGAYSNNLLCEVLKNKANLKVRAVSVLLDSSVLFDHLFLLLLLKGGQFLVQVRVGKGKNLHG